MRDEGIIVRKPTEDKAHSTNWTGTLELLTEKAPYEAVVNSRGNYYHFIYGKYINGFYISIPEWYIGCPMADYRDVHWNKNSLKEAGMSSYDAETIARAVSNLKKALGTNVTEYKQSDIGSY